MPKNRDKIGGTGKKFENKTVKTGGFAGIAGRIAAFSAVFCCLLCLAGMMWGKRDGFVQKGSSWINDDPVESGSGFRRDAADNRYILLNDTEGFTVKTRDASVTGVSFYTDKNEDLGKKTRSSDTEIFKVGFSSDDPSVTTESSFAVSSSGSGGKATLIIKGEDLKDGTGSPLEKEYPVYVPLTFPGDKDKRSLDINNADYITIESNVLSSKAENVAYILSEESEFGNALNSDKGIKGNLSDLKDGQGRPYGGFGLECNGKTFKITHNKNVGVLYLYLYFYESDFGTADLTVAPAKVEVKFTVTLGNITVNLNHGGEEPSSADIFKIYNCEKFNEIFFDGGDPVKCIYDKEKGIVSSFSIANTIGSITYTCKSNPGGVILKENGNPFSVGEDLIVTVYTVDRLAFLEGDGLHDDSSKKVAKGGKCALPFVYATNTVPTWRSGNTNVCTVDKSGIITGVNPGSTTVTGTVMSNGKKKEIVCEVTVVDAGDVLTLNKTSVVAAVNEQFRLEASGSAVKGSRWEVSDGEVLKVIESSTANGTGYAVLLPLKTGSAVVNIYNAEEAIMASCSVSVEVKPTKIEIASGDLKLNMGAGTYQLSVNMTPPNPYTPLLWQSNNTKVAEVDGNGLVTLKSPGIVVISVVPRNYRDISDSITINVTQPTTGLTIDIPEATMSVGEKLKLSYTLTPETATNKTVSWFSMDSKIASVDKNGLVTAKKIGVTYIYAVSQDGSYLAFSTITVIQAATGVKLDSNNLSLKVGDVYYLQATFTPNNATDKRLTWVSQDTKVCTVTNTGKVTAVNPGKTTIYAKTASGEVTFINVTVQANVLGLDLDETEKSVLVGRKFTLTPIFTPDEPTNQKVTWRSSNTGIATVDKDGNVVTKKVGMTVIVCTSLDGGYMANCAVTVRPGVSGLELDEKELRLKVGKSRKLNVTFTPEHPSSKKVKWKSSNPSVATVNDKGKVKALKGGSTIITCTSAVNDVSASCVVMVEQLITYIKLNKSTAYVGVGRTTQLRAKVDSNDVTNKQLKWTSNNTGIATVDKNGNVTGKARGTCYITCSATDGSKAKARCKIRVIRQITSLSLDKTTIRLVEGKSTRIRAIYKPSNAEHKKVTWSSTDEKIATIDRKGNIYAVAEGVCKIKAKAADGSGKRAECWLYVLKRVEASSVVISQRDLYMPVGDTENLNVSVLPANSTDSVSFSSDNKLIASVSNTGRVRALRPGQAVITCTTSSGKTATSTVTVLGLNWTSLNMRLYDSQTLRLEGMTTGVIWESEDKSVATVDTSGVVIARKPGTTRIIATVKGIKLYCRITVSGSI